MNHLKLHLPRTALIVVWLSTLPPLVFSQSDEANLRSAEDGNASAQFRLGLSFYKANKYSEALRWFRKAADQGHPEAQYDLGTLYDDGKGLQVDHVEAARWYLKAADQGEPHAEFNLGRMFVYGDTAFKRNDVQAARWFLKAAEHGHVEAQGTLGVMYAEGQGTPQDFVQAHMWLNVATSRENDDKIRRQYLAARDAVAAKMSSQQLAEAQRLAREWGPK